jgi:hypothetical protein
MPCFVSVEQVKKSLRSLAKLHPFFGTSFLAFKRVKLPVGRTTYIVFSQAVNVVLEKYYRADPLYPGFYSPFRTSKAEEKWVAPRYGSTSLQRITSDTFSDAFIHPKNSSEWGWREDYIQTLREHLDAEHNLIPLFDLAVWLYRHHSFAENVNPTDLNSLFLQDFEITPVELQSLFSPTVELAPSWQEDHPIRDSDLFDLIGFSPNAQPLSDAALEFVRLEQCGPADSFLYKPGDRLTIITGDNSLGKTFLLEAIWWALTGEWVETDQPLMPKPAAEPAEALISFGIRAGKRRQEFTAIYDWESLEWHIPRKRAMAAGVVLYGRFDGSFAIYDPATLFRRERAERNTLYFRQNEVWDGLRTADNKRVICNGLLSDWLSWERGGETHQRNYRDLISSLQLLSPALDENFAPGRPRRIASDAREIPTLSMPYGDIPITLTSAGVKRMLALAYMMVWAWNEHLANSSLARLKPSEKLILIVDEVEAHLHPRWQRVIVPALMKAVSRLVVSFEPQVHIATHSPLVLASAEPFFDEDIDKLFHLGLEKDNVTLEELPFEKEGRVDRWLTSPVFGLGSPRSVQAELVISTANALQRGNIEAKPETVEEVNSQLSKVLAQDDSYWPRWRGFYLRISK